MYEFTHFSEEKDLLGKITIEVPQNTIFIQKEEPYGFWRISMKKGTTPKLMRGRFTSPSEARRAVTSWINSNRHLKALSEKEE